jgi:hypothetical protein
LIAPCRVQLAELAVLVGQHPRLLRGHLILPPEQLKRNAGARQLAVHPVEVDGRARLRLAAAHVCEELRFDLCLAERLSLGPREACLGSSLDVRAHRGRRDVARARNLPMSAAQGRVQPKNLSDFSHG